MMFTAPPASVEPPPPGPEPWLASAQGQALLREENHQLRRVLDSVFGDEFLQVGSWGCDRFPAHARTQRRAVVAAHPGPAVDLVSDAADLAVQTDSIDVVLLAHALELHSDPHGVLREVNRVLRPDGHVVVLGFNPYGLWGLRHLVSRRRYPPGVHHLLSEHRIADWLRLLNFSVSHSGFYHYQLPFGPRAPRRSRAGRPRSEARPGLAGVVAERAQRALRTVRRWPPFAGCYVVVARKTMFTMTPIRPVWARRPRLVSGFANPTTRNAA